MDDRDIFSYDTSNKNVDDMQSSFDLNSFSTPQKKDEKPKKAPKNTKQKALKMVLTCFLIGVITVALVAGSFLLYAFTMVDGTVKQNLNDLQLNFTTTVYVENKSGEWEEHQRLHGEYNRIWVDYDEVAIAEKKKGYKGIPANLANAFIAIEDKGFETHYGVDWKRTFGALLNEFFHFSSKFGGSTITQQLVKNLTDDRKQDAGRKVREIMRARYLETKYTKDVILECYLNTIPMGHGTYGVQVAANYYFDKNVDELSLAECATLAAITKAPSYYAPDTNPENNKERRETVLYEMKSQGLITEKQYQKALKEKIKVKSNQDATAQNDINSYFVDALIEQVTTDLCDKYGYTKEKAEQLFYTGGYKIYATVDENAQEIVDKAYVDLAKKAKKSSKGDPLWGGMAVMDYEGNVKAIAGGIGEKKANRKFNCATDAKRQPGSTMKPISVYALAVENGTINYSSILNDTKATYGNWSPKNSGGGYSGNITAQNAIERSKNTIPVALANKMGVSECFTFLTEKLGLKYLDDEKDLNLSALGLGGTSGGITPLESAAAYAVFGNGGLYYEPTFYSKVTDQKGNIILEKNTKPVSAISEDTALVMNKLLQTVIYGKSGTATSVASSVSKMKLFGKTGTSSSNNDKWFVGGSPYYVVSSWCGYETMQNMPSANLGLAKSQWSTVMSKLHKGLKKKEFPESPYAIDRYYCTKSGGLATVGCKSVAIGWYKNIKNSKDCTYIPEPCQKHSGELMKTPKEVEKAKKEAEKANAENNSSIASSTNSSTATTSSTNSQTTTTSGE